MITYGTGTPFRDIIDTIDNCGSWGMVEDEIKRYKDELSKDQMITIFHYYWSVIEDFNKNNK